MAPRGRAELVGELSDLLPLRVFGLLMTISAGDLARLRQWRMDWIRLAYYPRDLDSELASARALVDMQRFFFRLIESRRAAPNGDVLSTMIETCLEGEAPLADYELVAEIMGVLEAGQESVSALIANAVYYLLSRRSRWESVIDEPNLIAAAVEETLRLDAGIRGVMRQAAVDTEIGGVPVPAGARLCVKLAAANRDPAHCPHAERFELQRAKCPHMSFGKGTHYCLGAELARLQGRAALAALIDRLPGMHLAGDGLETVGNLAFRMPKALWVQW